MNGSLLFLTLVASAEPPLLAPEPPAGLKPAPRDATQPVSIYSYPESYKPLHHGPTPAPEPIPVLPVRKPAQTLGDLRFYGGQVLAASPDGKLVACGNVRLFDTATGNEVATFHGHHRGPKKAIFSPDSKRLYTGEADSTALFGTLIVWDVAAKKQIIAIPSIDWALTPDGKRLVTLEMAPDDTDRDDLKARHRPVVRVRDTATWGEVAGFAVNGFRATAVALSPDANVLAVGGHGGTVRTWDIKEKKELAKLDALSERPAAEPKGVTPSVTHLAFDVDSKRLVGASGGVWLSSGVRQVVVWNWPAATVARRFDVGDRDLTALALAPDGKHLMAADGYRSAVWNLATGETVVGMTRDTHKRAIGTFAFVPGAERVYLSGDGFRPALAAFPSLELRPLVAPPFNDTPKVPFDLMRPITEPEPTEVKLPGGGKVRQLSYLNEREAGFVHTDADGKRVRVYEPDRHGSFAVTPDGKLLVTSSYDVGRGVTAYDPAKWENPIRFWDLTTGKEVGVIRVDPAAVCRLHLSPDGTRLAVLHNDGLVRVWDVGTRKPEFALDPTGHWPVALAFSKDGRSLVGGNPRSPVLVVWDVSEPKK